MSLGQTFAGAYQVDTLSLTIGNTTQAKILCDVAAGGAGSGDLLLTGGSRIIGGQIINSDGSNAKSLLFYMGSVLSTMTTGTHSIGSQNIITRGDSGNFLTDGWRVGDSLMIFQTNGSGTAANDGVLAQITARTSTTITVTGTPFTNDAAVPANTRLVRVAQRTRRGVPLNSGNADSTVPVNLLGGTQDVDMASQPDTGLQLGPRDVFIIAAVATLAALPARIDVHAARLLY